MSSASRKPEANKKLDLRKELRHIYEAAQDKVAEIDVPVLNHLRIDGKGDPNTSRGYREAVESLFATAYALKFAVKKSSGIDYSVMPLESLWWTERGKPFFSENKKDWLWSALIVQPPVVTGELLGRLLEQVKERKALPALARLRLEPFVEGKSLQTLHIGPYSAEGLTIGKLHQYAKEHGYSLSGRHHEIYLNTPQRTVPERLRTIIRQPVR